MHVACEGAPKPDVLHQRYAFEEMRVVVHEMAKSKTEVYYFLALALLILCRPFVSVSLAWTESLCGRNFGMDREPMRAQTKKNVQEGNPRSGSSTRSTLPRR